ncbi:MAG TPA: NAD(P)H-dependent glycerol-3-phosphate dehydrogenase [Longimicrobiales bacterium]|nr:NAD(P)H-dependent glycerol-3-phosphate dehydrogenase [Longimicrobiales bacterium]
MRERIGVVGAGSWGTTLANLLAKKGHDVHLWSYEEEVTLEINDGRVNASYLPDVELDGNLTSTSDLEEAVSGSSVVVSVSPSQHVRRVMSQAAGHMERETVVVSASKGIETSTLETMAEVLEDALPERSHRTLTFLSGPSFAAEVAREQPTAVTVASRNGRVARRVQDLFQTDYFRVYTSHDVVGVELGGALKNVMALAAGMAAGLGLGHNTRAALITRGLAEMSRLGVALGANPLTFAGLAGMGDLILTCTGDLSRNRSVGYALGQGRKLDDILGEMRMVAEGVETTRAAHALAQQEEVEMPIVAEVHRVLFEGVAPAEAVRNLMEREPKAEFWR